MQGIEEASLYAKASGYLKVVNVDKGDRVRRGQVLAVIESPELHDQQRQARAAYDQSLAATEGARAGKGRAEADALQAGAQVDRARADAEQGAAGVAKASADLAKAQAELPRLQAMASEADADAQQAVEQDGAAQAEVARWQQQLKAAQAALRAIQAAQQKAEADARLQQITYNRYKSIQEKDAGLVTGQQVDEARARMETSQSEVETARHKVEAANEEVGTARQQVESARRQLAAAEKKVEAVKSHAQAAHQESQVAAKAVDAARQQVKVAEGQWLSAERQVKVAIEQRRAMGQQVNVAAAQVSAARMQSEGSHSALSAAEALAGYTRLSAPFDGVVTERLADPGGFVQNAGTNQAAAKPVLKVVRDQVLRVLVPVPEASIPKVRIGQAAAVAVDAFPKEVFRGTVSRFAGALDPRSRTMLTEVDLPNPERRLKPGMYARVTLNLEIHHNALSVPSETVMGPEDKRFVYTVVNGHAHRTPVMVGVDDAKMVEITSGLTPGAQVVLVGRDTLVDGAAVKAQAVQPTPGAGK
jgi:RND family efflux transporter MFP subunit